MSTPAPATLRITDGHKGRVGVPIERSWALQYQTGEAKTPTGDVAGMFSFAFLSVIISMHIVGNFYIGLGKCYLWFNSLYMYGLYLQ